MKRLFLPFILALLFSSSLCNTLYAQSQKVRLHINHLLGGQAFALDKIVPVPQGYDIRVTSLRYYLSNFTIIHDGGIRTNASDVYVLVNPAENSDYDLGNFEVNSIEGIEFAVGVDKDKNHTDPASYPPNHALAPQNPIMHWGWAAGYRFLAIEGYAGARGSSVKQEFQIHTIGDELLRGVSLPLSASTKDGGLIITLNAEYTHITNGIEAEAGVIAHGNGNICIVASDNMQFRVFSVPETTTYQDANDASAAPTMNINISPNPAQSFLHLRLPATHVSPMQPCRIVISNILGQQLATYSLSSSTTTLPLNLNAGLYMLSVEQQGKTLARAQFVVRE